MSAHKVFITGTDTHVGKTYITRSLINGLQQGGHHCIGCKPIASGATVNAKGKLENDDAKALQQASSIELNYDDINAYTFAPSIAPHIAAQKSQQIITPITLDKMVTNLSQQTQWLIVEGAGGWQLPLSCDTFLSDWVISQSMSIILVVGGKLGCLNHALLTVEKIIQDGGHLIGWVFNQVDPVMDCVQENIRSLKSMIAAPCLGVFPYQPTSKIQYTHAYWNWHFFTKYIDKEIILV